MTSSGDARGLLGLAFAPDYVSSGRFFVNFTDTAGDTVVARFRRSSNPLIADAASRFDLHWGGATGPTVIKEPFSEHNGGNLVFGPDGFLYIGLGDGGLGPGNVADPGNRAQSPTELLGKMLRIDVNVPDSDPSGYRIPPDNPFLSGGPSGTLPEIWSFGLRNPWRYSFDDPSHGGSGALLLGDVGQGTWEEINYEPAGRGGRNYGWRIREGAHDFDPLLLPVVSPVVEPIWDYVHSGGQAVTGGFVYRGGSLGETYRGRYFFADFIKGRLWSLALTIDPVTGEASASDIVEHTDALGGRNQLGNISSFGVDAAAELYIVSYSRGAILKIVPAKVERQGDFDGDTKADISVFRPSTGTWYIRQSGAQTTAVIAWGDGTDTPVPGDYDGDGLSDVAIFRSSTGEWFIRQSSTLTTTAIAWGGVSDMPVAADYDGDGKTDAAIFRPSTGAWYIRQSRTLTFATFILGDSADIPVPGDYEGDGKTDIAVFRPETGEWLIRRSSTMTVVSLAWGVATDIPMPGDYDGDGKTDVAVFRRSTGTWYIRQSATLTMTALAWGGGSDIPVTGDYDGDGVTDVTVFRPSTGQWLVRQSSTLTLLTVVWGGGDDIPILKAP